MRIFFILISGIVAIFLSNYFYSNYAKKRMAQRESEEVAACKAFCTAEEIYRRTDYNKDGVLDYAKTLRGVNSLYESTSGAGDLALIDHHFSSLGGTSALTQTIVTNTRMTPGYGTGSTIGKWDGAGRNTFVVSKAGTIVKTKVPVAPVMRETGELNTFSLLDHSSNANAENPRVEPGKVHWAASKEAAFANAKTSHKPVLIFAMLGQFDKEFC